MHGLPAALASALLASLDAFVKALTMPAIAAGVEGDCADGSAGPAGTEYWFGFGVLAFAELSAFGPAWPLLPNNCFASDSASFMSWAAPMLLRMGASSAGAGAAPAALKH